MMEISWWHILIGFFFSNGMPHFLMGVAGKKFRSPLGANSSTQVNVVWGIINFILGTAGVIYLGATAQWYGFLIGFWLVVAMFGFGMNHFKGEDF
jgi:NhaP-type Na+/H+ or K+/H+ antiporter